MTDFSATSITAPLDWQAFERKSRLLFEYSFQDQQTQNNGRSGQPQNGVDIFGRRGGAGGHYVGVQCKGKDGSYGKAVTERELRSEVKKSMGFKPTIREFILATTAPDDAKIQEVARLLEQEVRNEGRDLSIAVWGWGRLQQEIARYPEAVREFHPDGSPFTDQILESVSNVARQAQDRAESQSQTAAANHQELLRAIESLRPTIALEASQASGGVEKHLNEEIDAYRDLIRSDKPKTAIDLLGKLRARVWTSASVRIRFRIASNLGAAHHSAGEYESAAQFLLEAADLEPEDPIGRANKIAALLLTERREEAHTLAVAAVARHPDNVHIAVQRLLAVSPEESVEEVWRGFPISVRTSPEVYINRIVSLREAEDDGWHQAAREGLAAHPSDWRLQTIQAEAVLERLLKNDPAALGRAGADVPTQAELENASDVLACAWRRSLNPEIKPQGAFAHNAALAKMIVGQLETAAKLLEEAEVHGFASDETKFMRIAIYKRQRRYDDAIRVSDTLQDSPRNNIVRAELRVHSAPEDVHRMLGERDQYADEREITGAAFTIMDAYCGQKDFVGALREAERLNHVLPNEPQGSLAIFRIKRECGDPEATKALDEAVARLRDNGNMGSRFLVCEALASVGRYREVAALLEPATSANFDSPSLRLLVAAELSADRRATLRKLFDNIPREVLDLPYYRRISIGLALSVGDLGVAERDLRELLVREPRSLELQLQLMSVLFRQNKEAELKTEVKRPSSDFIGTPENFIALAQFKRECDDARDAYRLAYETFLRNQGNERVNRAYAAIFLFDRRPSSFNVAPTLVAENTAVGIRREDGSISVYLIEPDPKLRPTNAYLSPDHALAKLLLGRASGEQLELPDHSRAEIISIKPKELHALHTVLEEFNNVFPDAEGLEKVRVDPSSEDGMQPLLERVRARHDAIASVATRYDNDMLPLTFVARLLGSDPVSTALGLASSGHKLKVCEGTDAERRKALRAIARNGQKGCIVDAITLHFIRRLRLERAVESVCGPIGLTENSVSRIQRQIHELEEGIDAPSMSIYYRDGQYFREEIAPEQKKVALDVQRSDRAWIGEHATIVPAEGTNDPTAEAVKLLSALGPSFLDDVRAASGSGRILLSEDLAMRVLAEAQYGVQGCWLQVVLMAATDKGLIKNDEYADAVLALIDANEEFISISSELLLYFLRGEQDHSLPASFNRVASRLGGRKADLESHVSVGLGVIGQTWRADSLAPILRQAIVGRLLESLIQDRAAGDVELLLRTFDDFARLVLKSEALRAYLRDWRRGHFL